jgi:hypothetical protein
MDVSVQIPQRWMPVLTGASNSGKNSLTFQPSLRSPSSRATRCRGRSGLIACPESAMAAGSGPQAQLRYAPGIDVLTGVLARAA